MKNLLLIRSSLNGASSITNQMLDAWLAHARQRLGEVRVVERDLARQPVPMLTAETMAAIRAGALETPAQREADRLARELVDEWLAADEIALGLPRYNFQAPAGFKAYVDYLLRPRVTFAYGPNGAEGKLRDVPVHALIASGSVYPPEDDIYIAWLRRALGFVGLKDVRVVHAEGVGSDAAAALAKAKAAIAAA